MWRIDEGFLKLRRLHICEAKQLLLLFDVVVVNVTAPMLSLLLLLLLPLLLLLSMTMLMLMPNRHFTFTLEQFILSQMHTLYNITTVIKYTSNVLSINCTREMRITIMLAFTSSCTDPLHMKKQMKNQKKSGHKEQSRVYFHVCIFIF